jgi:hypothetical protein
MKKLIIIITLFFPVLLFAQKKAGDLIKKHLYVKVSPTLFLGDGLFRGDNGTAFSQAVFGTVGAKIRYAALGFSIGHLVFAKAGNTTPFGADLTITDFKRKVFPVVTAQWHKVEYSKFYYVPGSGFHNATIYGKDMQSIGAGVAATVNKNLKFMATFGVSRLNYRLRTYWSPRENESHINYFDRHASMPYVAVNFVW